MKIENGNVTLDVEETKALQHARAIEREAHDLVERLYRQDPERKMHRAVDALGREIAAVGPLAEVIKRPL